MPPYELESYWTKVGERTAERSKNKLVAGDEEPYYTYKRIKTLELLNEVNFRDKSVLEVGCGPGGNLLAILDHKPRRLVGVDVSEKMIALARSNCPKEVEIIKTDGVDLPFADDSFDIVITVTVLQHNTNDDILNGLANSIGRVSKSSIHLFERIEHSIKGNELNYGRPISYYESLLTKSRFKLSNTKFININASYYLSGIIRKVFDGKKKEGEPSSRSLIALQKISLLATKVIDPILTTKRGLARLSFTVNKNTKD